MTMKDRVKELRRVPASELRANPKNWRRHPPSQEAALRGVLEDIGFADAVIARETDDGLELIDGHLRQEVMGDQVIPVLIVDVTEEEADKMLLTYDPLAMMAHADQDQLLQLLRDTQFESQAVNDMLEAVANGERLPMPDLTEPVEDPGPQIDRADELREKWQTERGQVWEVGRHRLMCGDCTDDADLHHGLMVGKKAQAMIADPPYGVASGMGDIYKRAGLGSHDALRNSVWDKDVNITNLLTLVPSVLLPDCSAYIFTSHMLFGEVQSWLCGWTDFNGFCVWHKTNPTPSLHHRHWTFAAELVAYGVRGKHKFYYDQGTHMPNVWAIPKGDPSVAHPTQKPVAVIKEITHRITDRDDICLDLFLGSGTTMVAAEQLGRICYGMEIEPKYVAVTLERMAGMGLEPKLVE